MANTSPLASRIGIDCRLAGSQHGGIGRYIENLVTRIIDREHSTTWVLFFFDEQQANAVLGKRKSLAHVEVIYVPIRHYTIAEQLKLPTVFGSAKLDVLHVPHFNIPLFYRGKLIVTIHDLLWHEYKGTHVTTLPAWQYWIKHQMYLFTVGQAVRRAAKILVPAQTIKRTLLKYYPKMEAKVVVTKEGVDQRLLSGLKSTLHPTKMLLYVGSLYPHKNIRLVIDALSSLHSYKLLIAGTRNVFQDQVRKYVAQRGVNDQVEFLGFVPDEELIKLYPQVTALVQPSFSEGFGLTGVEAMAAGVPLLASDIPLFQEIYQRGALYFNPHKPESFVQAVHKLEKTDRRRLIAKGRAVADQYSWESMAEQTLAVYHQVS